MAKRFSRYRFALKANEGGVQAGSPLAKYKDFATGAATPDYTTSPDSLPESFETLVLVPFSVNGDKYYSTISKRSQDKIGVVATALTTTVLNHITDPNDGSVILNPGFSPAKAVVSDGSGTSTTETSQITGVQYKSKNAKSYTFPFGNKATATLDDTYLAKVQAIRTIINAVDTLTVSFRPEQFRL